MVQLSHIFMIVVLLLYFAFILEAISDKFENKLFIIKIFVVVLVIINCFLNPLYRWLNTYISWTKKEVQFLFIYIYLFYGLFYLLERDKKKPKTLKTYLVSYLAFLILGISWLLGQTHATNIVFSPKYKRESGTLELNDSRIIHFNTDTILLGQNTSYYFFYVSYNNSKFIIPKSNMVRIQFY
jgi:hypothetical protein